MHNTYSSSDLGNHIIMSCIYQTSLQQHNTAAFACEVRRHLLQWHQIAICCPVVGNSPVDMLKSSSPGAGNWVIVNCCAAITAAATGWHNHNMQKFMSQHA
jgi:hypothetical protein